MYNHNFNIVRDSISRTEIAKPNSPFGAGVAKPVNKPYTRTLLIGRLKSEDVFWTNELNGLNHSIYAVDDADSLLKVPQNKGHEAMVYLSYIIDHYDNLPDTVLFLHPPCFTRHNNNILLELDSWKLIERLSDAQCRLRRLLQHAMPSGPWLLRLAPSGPPARRIGPRPQERRAILHAVSLARPLPRRAGPARTLTPECVRYWDWLLETKLEDEVSGRMMEYTWQYILTGLSEVCPSQHECYCDGDGIYFGGTTKTGLRNRLALLKRREKMDAHPEDIRRSNPNDADAMAAALVKRDALKAELEKRKQEACQRSDDPRNRALESGRPWKEGDGY